MTELITFILFVFVSSFIINGWYEVTRNGRIFSFWSKYWEHYTNIDDENPSLNKTKFPEWISSPLSACIMCMASIYGTIIFVLVDEFEGAGLFQEYSKIEVIFIWIAYLLCLTCSNYIVHKKLK